MSDRRERIRLKTAEKWNEMKYAAVGLEFGLSVLLCYFAGEWAQERWGFEPWGELIGITLGFIAGLRRLIQIAEREARVARDERNKQKEEGKDDV